MKVFTQTNRNINNTNFYSKPARTDTPDKKYDENPISRKGETANIIKATFVGGLVLGGKLLLELVDDGDFLLDILADRADKIIDQNKKNAIKNKRFLYKVGAFFALIAAGISAFALLYTAANTPKIVYKSKVNTFKNSKEMDVYIKSNNAEKELYTQLAEEAKTAETQDQKDKLKEEYVKMTMAKNQVPNLVKK